MKRTIPALILLLATAPAYSFPTSGLYYQLPNTYEVNLYDGIFQLHLTPSNPVNKEQQYAILDWALRFPIPIIRNPFDIPISLSAIGGYHQQLNARQDVIRGVDIGAGIAYYPIDWLGLHVKYTGTNLLQGRINSTYPPMNYMYLPKIETGITLDLPYKVVLGIGYQLWSTPESFYQTRDDFPDTLSWLGGFEFGVNWKYDPFGRN